MLLPCSARAPRLLVLTQRMLPCELRKLPMRVLCNARY